MCARRQVSILRGSFLRGSLILGLCVAAILGFRNQAMSYTEYLLGMTCPRSGDQTFIGDLQLSGVEIAMEEING